MLFVVKLLMNLKIKGSFTQEHRNNILTIEDEHIDY